MQAVIERIQAFTLHKISDWIFANFSELNIPVLDLSSQTVIHLSHAARFIVDLHLIFSDQLSSLPKSCFNHIRGLRRIRRFLNYSTAITVATSLVQSKHNYCNYLYLFLPQTQLSRL